MTTTTTMVDQSLHVVVLFLLAVLTLFVLITAGFAMLPVAERPRWVGGVSGLWSSFYSATNIRSPALPNGNYAATQSTANLAAFGEITVPIVDRLRAFAGLRFTHELKNFNGIFYGAAGGPPALALWTAALIGLRLASRRLRRFA